MERDEGSTENLEMIIVRGRNAEFRKTDEYEDEDGFVQERSYDKEEFHRVDLKEGKIRYNFIPPILNCHGGGKAVALGPTVYIFGGLNSEFDSLPHPKEQLHHSYMGGSRYDVSSKEWAPAPLPTQERVRWSPVWVSLCGKVYGFQMIPPQVEVFDPEIGESGMWRPLDPLPPKFDGFSLCPVVAPDPQNHRIIVRLSKGRQGSWLCAFYPPVGDDGQSRWELLAEDFFGWSEVVAVVNDVLYICDESDGSSDGGLSAYDLAARKLLKVSWISSPPDQPMKDCSPYDSLFALSSQDGVLCYAKWVPDYKSEPIGAAITLFKFRVERSHTVDSTIAATSVSVHPFILPYTSEVYDFFPLAQEAFY